MCSQGCDWDWCGQGFLQGLWQCLGIWPSRRRENGQDALCLCPLRPHGATAWGGQGSKVAGQYQPECLPWGKSSLESDSSPPAVAKMSRMNHLPKSFISHSLNRAHFPTPAWRPPMHAAPLQGPRTPGTALCPVLASVSPPHHSSSSPMPSCCYHSPPGLASGWQTNLALIQMAVSCVAPCKKPSHWPRPGGHQACKGKGPSQTIRDAGRAPEQVSPCCGNPFLTLAGIQGTAQLGGVGDH